MVLNKRSLQKTSDHNALQSPNKKLKKSHESEKYNKEGNKFSRNSVNKTKNDINEKPDWKKYKCEKKELINKRKQSRKGFDVIQQAKKIYEKLKCKKTSKETRKQLAIELNGLLGKVENLGQFAMAHDTARITQCLFKYLSEQDRESIGERLLPFIVEMSMSTYAHFCVLRILKLGNNSLKKRVIDTLFGHIVHLASHAVAHRIVDTAYVHYADSQQKVFMKQEFYSELYKKEKDKSVQKMADVYKEMPAMKIATQNAVKANLEHCANKKLLDNGLLHSVLLEYLKECEEADRNEVISMFSGHIASLVTTSDGCEAAMLCFWHSSTKDRRAIIKSLKEHLEKICVHEQGHVLLMGILNTLDDTKAIKKVIFESLLLHLEKIALNQWGRNVLQWFINPADTKCFHPRLINYLDDGLKYSKKDKEIRRAEIFQEIQEPLCKEICENPSFWLQDRHLALVVLGLLKKMNQEYFVKAATRIVEVVCDIEWKVKLEQKESNTEQMVTGIEDAGLHMVLKKILQNDKQRQEQKEPTFSEILMNNLSVDTIKHWVKYNRGCFILVNMIENGAQSVKSNLRKLLTEHVGDLDESHTGAKLLLKKLNL